MFSVALQVTDNGLIDAYKALLSSDEATQAFIQRSTTNDVNRTAEDMLRVLRTEPGPVKYPIRWTSVKQRKAFFASNGFGRGIPAVRSHELANGWKYRVIYTPGQLAEVEVENPAPYEQFVTGRNQQAFHAITGWNLNEMVFEDYSRKMADRVETSLIRGFYAIGES